VSEIAQTQNKDVPRADVGPNSVQEKRTKPLNLFFCDTGRVDE
jgi:hypothetical protein